VKPQDIPRVVSFDIETSPIIAYTWGPKWETNLIEVIEQSQVMSYSAKWLRGKHITRGWPHYRGYRRGILNDRRIVEDIWKLLDSADILIVQNGKQFDVRVMNARFVFYGLRPPSPYKVVDTKTEAKKYLRLPSNGLNDICDYFGIGRKVGHEGFSLWKGCMDGDRKAWKRMLRYNKHDVLLTEKLYLLLLPWIQSHPNVGMYKGEIVCPKCGSDRIQARGLIVTKTIKYRRIHCQNCGGWGRVSPTKNPKTVVSI